VLDSRFKLKPLVDGSPSRRPHEKNINTVSTATRSALFSGLSLPGDTTAESAFLVITGNPDQISRKGVQKSRRWLENETGSVQVRGGDFPTDSEQMGDKMPADVRSSLGQLLSEARTAATGGDSDIAEALLESAHTVATNKLPDGTRRDRLRNGCLSGSAAFDGSAFRQRLN
jgi:hypothetical protein